MDFRKNSNKLLINLLAGVVLISLILIYQPSYSKNLSHLSKLSDRYRTSSCNFVVGVDGIFIMTNTRGDYEKIFRKNRVGSDFYIGYMQKDVMLELGYLSTIRKSKDVTIETGKQFLAGTTTEQTKFSGKVKFKNTHIDLNFCAYFTDNWRVITLIGVGFVRLGIKFTATNMNGQPLATPYHDILGKTNTIPRFGFGLTNRCTENMSIKLMAYYDRYSRIRTKLPGEPHNKPFRDAYTGSIGVFFNI